MKLKAVVGIEKSQILFTVFKSKLRKRTNPDTNVFRKEEESHLRFRE